MRWWRGGSCCGRGSRGTRSITCSAAGRLLPLYRGVYAVGHRPVGPRSREMAVVLLAGRAGALGRAELALGLWAMTPPVARAGARDRRRSRAAGRRLRDPPHARPAARGRDRPLGNPRDHAPAEHCSTSPARSPSMPWTPRWPRRWSASSSRSRTSQPRATGNLRNAARPRRRRRSPSSSATSEGSSASTACRSRSATASSCGYEVDLHWPELNASWPSSTATPTTTTGEPSRPTANATSCSPPPASGPSASPTAS